MVEYDAMQVCVNGHYITDRYHSQPEYRENYCSKCGAETIKECSECGEDIPGEDLDSTVAVIATPSIPDHCDNCGEPFPWTQSPDEEELMDVRSAIREGESERIELKEEMNNPRDISKELVALANKEGGILLVGVEDGGDVGGIENIGSVEERITGHIRSSIDPTMDPRVQQVVVDGEDILAIQVPKAEEMPYNLNGTYYIRTGTTTDKLSSKELGKWYG